MLVYNSNKILCNSFSLNFLSHSEALVIGSVSNDDIIWAQCLLLIGRMNHWRWLIKQYIIQLYNCQNPAETEPETSVKYEVWCRNIKILGKAALHRLKLSSGNHHQSGGESEWRAAGSWTMFLSVAACLYYGFTCGLKAQVQFGQKIRALLPFQWSCEEFSLVSSALVVV